MSLLVESSASSAPASTITHAAIDGSLVDIAVGGMALPPDFTSDATARVGAGEQVFCAGLRAHGEAFAVEPDFGTVAFTSEYSFQDGLLRIGSGDAPPGPDGAVYMDTGPNGEPEPSLRWVAVWEGHSFSVHAQDMGGQLTEAILIDKFDQISVAETPQGIVLRSMDGTSLTFTEGPSVSKYVPGLALFSSTRLTAKTARMVPRWSGTRVRGGELFVADQATEAIHFVIVGETAITDIVPEPGKPVDSVLAVLPELRVDWR